MSGAAEIERAIRAANAAGRPAIVAFLTAGYPDRKGFTDRLRALASEADVIEIGVPFTDPMADGLTIQNASRKALANGVNLRWILDEVKTIAGDLDTPMLLMGYLNPLLRFGFDRLASAAREAGIAGFIVPDLPLEECADFHRALTGEGLALVQLVTPVTPPDRLAALCAASSGFVYAVTVTGITGSKVDSREALNDYLARVRGVAEIPVCAGFGIKDASQVEALGGHADGVVVGTALIEALNRGDDPAAFLRALKGKAASELTQS